MKELKMFKTECQDCQYLGVTWHESEEELNRCRKCKGLLKIIQKELKENSK